MKVLFKFILSAAIGLLMLSCTSEQEIPQPKSEVANASPYKVELSEALKSADAMFRQRDESEQIYK